MNLTDGSAVHHGIAVGLATKDWQSAYEAAGEKFEEEAAGSTLLEEERPMLNDHKKLVLALVELFEKGFRGEDYQIIQPECSFDVELPDTQHNCPWVHWFEMSDPAGSEPRLGPPPPEMILAGRVVKCTCRKCYVSHRLVGKTDAIVAWRNNIWLLEHKTTAIMGQQFWDQFLLDLQPTTYVYGVYRALGIRPSGVVVNALYKPSEKQVQSWARGKAGVGVKDYIKYEREPFLRSKEDLERVEQQYIDICDEWEDRMFSGKWPLSNIRTVCLSYNRRCDFHGACMAHEAEGTLDSLGVRKQDYVNDKLVQIQQQIKETK